MTKPNQRDIGAMRVPHRRDISARQDLLGRELRQLFDDYTQEEMPDELERLALQLQSAFEARPAGADAKSAVPATAPSRGQAGADGEGGAAQEAAPDNADAAEAPSMAGAGTTDPGTTR